MDCVLAGPIPWGPTPQEQLCPLTMIEENLVAVHRVYRLVYVMKPATWSWGYDGTTRQLCQRAHVIAVPNVGADKVRDVLLPRMRDIGDYVDVVFLSLIDVNNQAEAEAALQKMAKRSPALKIRGDVVVKWACHLCRVSRGTVWVCRCHMNH